MNAKEITVRAVGLSTGSADVGFLQHLTAQFMKIRLTQDYALLTQ
jgi:hypothetical protein